MNIIYIIFFIIVPLHYFTSSWSIINTFRDNAPFFQQQEKNRFLRNFFSHSTGEKMNRMLLSGFGPESSAFFELKEKMEINYCKLNSILPNLRLYALT